jgi:eukaryotic-like serine/threonine-protein kinase
MKSEQTLLNERYQLIHQVGSGGMAVVYEARDLMLERPVAIKILRQNFSQDPTFRERFRLEAKAAANLTHPNIVTVHDFGLSDGYPFIVMEHVPGDHLKNIIRRVGSLRIEQVLELMIQACAGVGYAHRAGLIHCDIKPHNMLVTPDQRLKVTDFGIARALASVHPDEQAEVVWGSPQYFAPEQAAGYAPSPASDVYSLGIVMYEALTGTLPFSGNSAEDLAHKHQSMQPPLLRSSDPTMPPELDDVVQKILAKEPSYRYRNADQLGRILEGIRTSLFDDSHRREEAYSTPLDFEETILQEPVQGPIHIPVPVQPAKTSPIDIDWLGILLGLVALAALGGLIPFWIWVYYSFLSPIQ